MSDQPGSQASPMEQSPPPDRSPGRIVEVFRTQFADDVVRCETFRGDVAFTVRRDRIVDLVSFLKDSPDGAFDYLVDITAVDCLQVEEIERFVVVYLLYSHRHNHRLRLRALVPDTDPCIATLTGHYQAANWLEREVYDLFGIGFTGHPDMQRLLMPDDYEGHPLRKDYPLAGRGERAAFRVIRRTR